MKKSSSNKAVSVLLSVAMCPMLVPTAAFAAEEGAASDQAAVQAEAQTEDTTQAAAEGAIASTQAAEESAEVAVQADEASQPTDNVADGTVAVNGKSYTSLEEAFAAAEPVNGVITYTINGKVTVARTAANSWSKLTMFNESKYPECKTVNFIAGSGAPEICVNDDVTVFGSDEIAGLNVSFEGLTLSRTKAAYKADAAEGTNYFSVWASGGSVLYSNCSFPNGSHNNWYGATAYENCSFANYKTSGSKYGLWISADSSNAVSTSIAGCKFTGARGAKVYYTASPSATPSLSLSDTTFTDLADADYAAINVDNPTTVKMDNVSAINCQVGLLKSKGSVFAGTIPCGSGVSGELNIQASASTDAGKGITAGSFVDNVSDSYLAEGVTMKDNGDSTYSAEEAPTNVVEVTKSNGQVVQYSELNSAAVKAARNGKVKLLADVTVSSLINVYQSGTYTFDLGGFRIKSAVASSTAPVIQVNASSANVVVNAEAEGGIDGGKGAAANYAFLVNKGSLTVNGGSYTVGLDSQGNANPVIYAASSQSKVVINGGSFAAENPQYTLNCKDGSGASIQVNGGTFVGFDPFNNIAEGEGTNFLPEGAGVNRTIAEDGSVSYSVARGVAQVVDVDGKSVAVFETLEAAVEAAQDGQTVKLTSDAQLAKQLVTDVQDLTLDLNGKTLSNSYSGGAYSLCNNAPLTIKNGTYVSTSSNARGIGAYDDLVLDGVKVSAAGLVGVAACKDNGGACTIGNSEITGGYAFADFGNGTRLSIANSKIAGTWCGIYHNGIYSGFALNAENSTITAGVEDISESNNDTTAILVSGSSETESAAGLHSVSLIGCTVWGGSAVEAKYTNVTLDGCSVKATASKTEYTQSNDGSASIGFAVVLTDNATGSTAPSPTGTITIKGDGNYKGNIGLKSLPSVEETFGSIEDANYQIEGGTFDKEVLSDYCAEGFAPAASTDAEGNTTYGVSNAVAIVGFMGGSLRMDYGDTYDKTCLRFGYHVVLPEGAILDSFGWNLMYGSIPNKVYEVVGTSTKLDADGSGFTANLVITGVKAKYYTEEDQTKMWVKYKTSDGKTVTCSDSEYKTRSVKFVANAISVSPSASEAEKSYAKGILDAI